MEAADRAVLIVGAALMLDACRWGYERAELSPEAPGSLAGAPAGQGGAVEPVEQLGGSGGEVESFGGAALGGMGGTGTGGTGTGGSAAGGTGVVTGDFSPPTLIAEIVQAGAADDDPSFTEDRLELYFATDRGTATEEIWFSTRTSVNEPWGTPTALGAAINATDVTAMPGITSDGLTLYFVRRIPGVGNTRDIYASTRVDRTAAWGTPVLLASNDPNLSDNSPSGTSDGLFLIWGWGQEIATSERASVTDPWAPLQGLAEVNTASSEGEPWISDNRLHLVFRRSTGGSRELFASDRDVATDPFPAPVPIDSVNTASDETDPWLTQDLSYMIFSSDRDGMSRLYEASRAP